MVGYNQSTNERRKREGFTTNPIHCHHKHDWCWYPQTHFMSLMRGGVCHPKGQGTDERPTCESLTATRRISTHLDTSLGPSHPSVSLDLLPIKNQIHTQIPCCPFAGWLAGILFLCVCVCVCVCVRVCVYLFLRLARCFSLSLSLLSFLSISFRAWSASVLLRAGSCTLLICVLVSWRTLGPQGFSKAFEYVLGCLS